MQQQDRYPPFVVHRSVYHQRLSARWHHQTQAVLQPRSSVGDARYRPDALHHCLNVRVAVRLLSVIRLSLARMTSSNVVLPFTTVIYKTADLGAASTSAEWGDARKCHSGATVLSVSKKKKSEYAGCRSACMLKLRPGAASQSPSGSTRVTHTA